MKNTPEKKQALANYLGIEVEELETPNPFLLGYGGNRYRLMEQTEKEQTEEEFINSLWETNVMQRIPDDLHYLIRGSEAYSRFVKSLHGNGIIPEYPYVEGFYIKKID
jgi:hypothetical protein